MKRTKSKTTNRKPATRVGSGTLVRLHCRLTSEEHGLLMTMLGMASNDPGDLDHLALTSLREKIRDGSPVQPNARLEPCPRQGGEAHN